MSTARAQSVRYRTVTLKLYGAAWVKGKRVSKRLPTLADTDSIESIIDAGLGHERATSSYETLFVKCWLC